MSFSKRLCFAGHSSMGALETGDPMACGGGPPVPDQASDRGTGATEME